MKDLDAELEKYRKILTEEQYDLAKVGLRFVEEAKARWLAEVARLAQTATDPEDRKRKSLGVLDRELARARSELAAVHAANAQLQGKD